MHVCVWVQFVYFDGVELCHELAVCLLCLFTNLNINLIYASILIVATVCSVLLYSFCVPFCMQVYWVCKLCLNYYVGRSCVMNRRKKRTVYTLMFVGKYCTG